MATIAIGYTWSWPRTIGLHRGQVDEICTTPRGEVTMYSGQEWSGITCSHTSLQMRFAPRTSVVTQAKFIEGLGIKVLTKRREPCNGAGEKWMWHVNLPIDTTIRPASSTLHRVYIEIMLSMCILSCHLEIRCWKKERESHCSRNENSRGFGPRPWYRNVVPQTSSYNNPNILPPLIRMLLFVTKC